MSINIHPQTAAALCIPRWAKLPIPSLRVEQARAIEAAPRSIGTGPRREFRSRVLPVCRVCGKRVRYVRDNAVLGRVCADCYTPEREAEALRKIAAQRLAQSRLAPAMAAHEEAKAIRARIAAEDAAKVALMAKMKALRDSFK